MARNSCGARGCDSFASIDQATDCRLSSQDGKLLALPTDISRLAKHLGFDSYYVYGQSGGGPYAIACAYVLPKDKLKGVGLVSGLGPRFVFMSWRFRL